ncbi:MAG: hypothetical protein RLZ44_786 [Pseudomonadota bacterium]|jgi:succinylglutamate desuccinylase
MKPLLQELESLPEGLLDLPAEALHRHLGGPTLLHLPGRREPALFVAVLMHGNETTGWDAVRQLLRGYAPGGGEQPLPRALSLFIGNTAAAAQGVRHLPEQPDYNRVWPGSDSSGTPEHALMAEVVARMAARGVFASVDIHNNTGLNPHYACVNMIETRTLHLAAMFGRTVVYFVRPRGVASMAMAALCPSVTLECGKVGQAHGADHALSYVEACLRLSEHPQHAVAAHDVDLYHTVATVKVPPEVSFGFDAPGSDLDLADDLELLNFRELPPGTLFARVRNGAGLPLEVRDERNRPVDARFFSVSAGEVRTRCAVMPSMLTRNEQVIRQDCLCYLMERYDQHLEDALPA